MVAAQETYNNMDNMDMMVESKHVFRNFPEVRYATDVIFQKVFHPSGFLQEGKNTLVVSITCTAIKQKYQFC